jgi:hypothetical protein
VHKFNYSFLLFFFLLITSHIQAQHVYERNALEVNQFLVTMSQKGFLEWNDLITPNTKEKIVNALNYLQSQKKDLNALEQNELEFYIKEYSNQRKKLFYKSDSSFSLNIDPIISAAYVGGKDISYKETGIGVSLWGNISNKMGYQFSFQDINQNGSLLDTSTNIFFKQANRGIVALNDPNTKRQINYTDLRASLVYHFKNGLISVGQDALTWGYGENGQLVLSNKAPYYPYVRIDYAPLDWLRFNYTHAFLQSNVIDSSNTYTIPSNIFPSSREVFIKKYMASHSIDIKLRKGVHLSLGESIIYNDQLQLGYLLPVMFFKGYDNFINKGIIQAGSNGQFFGQFSTRNFIIPKSQIYTTLFIDEIRIASIFDPIKARNQVGFNIGIVKQDVFVPNLIVGAEYTRLNPFLYRNFLPAQNYTSNGYPLGEWGGANSDKFLFYLKYSPLPRLKTYFRYQTIRKMSDGTLQEQYFGQPQMGFLKGSFEKHEMWYFKTSYECANRFILNVVYNQVDKFRKEAQFGFSYGL